jgi:hypothetical protein
MKFGKRRLRMSSVLASQDFQQCEAVVDGAMAIVEKPDLSHQIAKLRPFEAA